MSPKVTFDITAAQSCTPCTRSGTTTTMAAAAQDVGAGGGTPQLRLAPHFPFVPKPCAAVAEPFFQCFSDKSVQPEGGVRSRTCHRARCSLSPPLSRLAWCWTTCWWHWRWLGLVCGVCAGTGGRRLTTCVCGRGVCVWTRQDPHSGRRALAACAELMKPYDECTRKHLASRKQKIYRAPEAYTKPESQ